MAKFQVKEKEALELEAIEKREAQRQRTERALFHPTVPKHKQERYSDVKGKIIAGRFNDNQLRERIMKKIYKYNSHVQVSDPMIRGGI